MLLKTGYLDKVLNYLIHKHLLNTFVCFKLTERISILKYNFMRIMKDKASLFMDNETWKWTVTKKQQKTKNNEQREGNSEDSR